MRPLRMLLIFPPNFSVDQPYISTPMLKAFLKNNGIKYVDQFDANLDSFYFFTRKDFLKKKIVKVKDYVNCLKESTNFSDKSEKEKYQYLCESILYYPKVIQTINKSIRYFKTSKKTTIEEYDFHKNIIERTFDIISAAYYPTYISHKNFSMRFSNQAFDEILQATRSDENPYIEYFEELIKQLNFKDYDVIGFSITALSQIIPSFTLISLLKKEYEGIRIVIGGQVFNRLEKNIKEIPTFFEYIDYLILGEGETPLLTLIEFLSGKRKITDVPNLLFFDRSKNKVMETHANHRENIKDIPTPDYEGLSLSEYLSPFPVLSYQPARGCYWGKCTFCNQFLIAGKGLRSKKPSDIVHDLRHLTRKYKTAYISIVNESLPPSIFRQIAQLILEKKAKLRWYAGARFDPGFNKRTLEVLKQSGCEKLYFGLESGSQKVIDEMNKGTKLAVIRNILRDAKEVGIGIHLFIMIGFPTEREADLKLSFKFIEEIIPLVDKDAFSNYISIYQLKPHTPVFNHPTQFNMKNIFRKEGYDLEYIYGYERKDKTSTIAAYEKARNKLECIIDKYTGIKKYPENICHFMTFKQYLKKEDKKYTDKVAANPCLSGAVFERYCSRGHSPLLYDFMNDNLFVMPNRSVMNLVLCTKDKFSKEDWERRIKGSLPIENHHMASAILNDLINNNILF